MTTPELSHGARRLARTGWLAGYEVIEQADCDGAHTYRREIPRMSEYRRNYCACAKNVRCTCYRAGDLRRYREYAREYETYSLVRVTVRHLRSGESLAESIPLSTSNYVRMRHLLRMARSIRARILDKKACGLNEEHMIRVRRRHAWEPIEIPFKRIGELDVKLRLLNTNFGPIGPEPHIGLELECGVIDLSNLREELAIAGLAIKADVVGDGSVHVPNCESVEVRLCCRQRELTDVVQKACKALANAQAKVNRTCGLHVHIDCRKRDSEKVYARLVRALKWLYAIVSPSRRTVPDDGQYGGFYCHRNRSTRFRGERNRYRAINAHAFSRHKTIEVRLHHGTIDAAKILPWVRLLLAIVDGPDVKRVPSDLYGFAAKYQLPLDVVEYLAKRARELGGAQAEGLILPPLSAEENEIPLAAE